MRRKYIEHDEQVMLVKYMKAKYKNAVFYAIPNGGSRNAIEAKRLKDEGVTPGVPDIFIAEPVGPYNGMYVEMKRPISSGHRKPSTSRSQIEMMRMLTLRGYRCDICYGFDDAKNAVDDYMISLSCAD